MLDSRKLVHSALGLLCMLLVAGIAAAQPPAGYYDTVDGTTSVTLRQTLHPVIDDHTRFPYTSSNPDTWDILNMADEDPNDTGRVVDIYKNASYAKISGGTGAYNREHSWPKSYGFPSDGSTNYPYTDTHHLFVSDSGYNSSRSNKPYRECSASCIEKATDFTDGRGGGSGTYVGNSSWTEGSYAQGTWETWVGRRGDVARALMYMDIRYEGGTHGITGVDEPDLILTDIESLIDASSTGSNESTAYMGMLSTLILWHQQDPVDFREIWRNEVVYSFQGNRNPFIDHPEWVDCLFLDQCSGGPDTAPPAAPTGLAASAGDGSASLTWNPNGEGDLSGYNVYRATFSGGPYTKINASLLVGENYSDSGLSNGTTYHYVVSAVDTSGNESGDSNESSATPASGGGGGGGAVVISEVFYDPAGSDSGLEWVELFNTSSSAVDLSGYSLGNGGTDYTYSTVQLSGSIPAGGTFVVGGPTSNSSNANPNFDQTVDFNPDFQNSGSTADGVALFDVPAAQINGSTVPIDAVVYGGSNSSGLIDESGSANAPEVADAASGQSIERIDNAGAWRIQSAPTPNSIDGTDLTGGGGGAPGNVLLSEVFYDAVGTDNKMEWVELYNAGGTAVDLSTYSLGAGGTDYTYSVLQLEGTIEPGETFVVGGPSSKSANYNPSFDLKEDFGPDLQNSGSTADGIALFDIPAAQITGSTVPIDAVIYGGSNANALIDETGSANSPEVSDASSGSSIEREDLAGAWRIQSSPTPNSIAGTGL